MGLGRVPQGALDLGRVVAGSWGGPGRSGGVLGGPGIDSGKVLQWSWERPGSAQRRHDRLEPLADLQ